MYSQKMADICLTSVLEPSTDMADLRPPSPRHLSELSRANDGGGRNGGMTGFNVSLLMLEWGGLISCHKQSIVYIY